MVGRQGRREGDVQWQDSALWDGREGGRGDPGNWGIICSGSSALLLLPLSWGLTYPNNGLARRKWGHVRLAQGLWAAEIPGVTSGSLT